MHLNTCIKMLKIILKALLMQLYRFNHHNNDGYRHNRIYYKQEIQEGLNQIILILFQLLYHKELSKSRKSLIKKSISKFLKTNMIIQIILKLILYY